MGELCECVRASQSDVKRLYEDGQVDHESVKRVEDHDGDGDEEDGDACVRVESAGRSCQVLSDSFVDKTKHKDTVLSQASIRRLVHLKA